MPDTKNNDEEGDRLCNSKTNDKDDINIAYVIRKCIWYKAKIRP